MQCRGAEVAQRAMSSIHTIIITTAVHRHARCCGAHVHAICRLPPLPLLLPPRYFAAAPPSFRHDATEHRMQNRLDAVFRRHSAVPMPPTPVSHVNEMVTPMLVIAIRAEQHRHFRIYRTGVHPSTGERENRRQKLERHATPIILSDRRCRHGYVYLFASPVLRHVTTAEQNRDTPAAPPRRC